MQGEVEDIDAVDLSSSPFVVHTWHVGGSSVERTWWSDDLWEKSRSRSFAEVVVDPSISVWTGCVVSNGGKAAVAARRWLQGFIVRGCWSALASRLGN